MRRKLEKEAWEIKSLGEIATEISTGRAITKDRLGTGDYPVIYWPEILYSKECANITECAHKTNLKLITGPRYCQYGDLLIASYCKRLSTLGKGIVYLGNEKPIFSNNIIKVEHRENPRFLLYVLNSNFAKKQILVLIEEAVMVALKTKHLRQIKIPLPPRHIQDKVAIFLDQFSELKEQVEEELIRELESRKKQYEYYKEALLGRGSKKWEMVSLDKVSTEIISGKEVTKAQLGTGDYPAIRYAEIFKSFLCIEKCQNKINSGIIKSPRYCEYGDLLIAGSSENLQDAGKAIVYLGNERPIVGSDVLIVKHSQNPKFLSYVLSSESIRQQIKLQARGVIVIHLGRSSFQHIKIPLPPIEEQNKIVEVLDKLRINIEALQNEIPLLIEDLRKQYLYFQKQMLDPEII